ncbi:MAG TPA: hypothetical protein VN213_16390, partial [Solirubrobacteraceae bacterium]|nr:hypothetical protein [Solirubrobacteraceae bacterium]
MPPGRDPPDGRRSAEDRVVELAGTSLAPEDVVAVARGGASAVLGDAAREAMERSARVVARHAVSGEP